MPKRPQSPREELANALSHGIGLLAALVAIPFLIRKAMENQEPSALVGAAVFSLGVVMVYTFSTLYHSARSPRNKARLQVLDHISIYFLIAGSYTPMMLTVLAPRQAMIFLGILWGSVLAGSVLKLFFTGRFKVLSVAIYLLMGWLAVFFLEDIAAKISFETLAWVGAGGLAYTAGVFFYVQSDKPFYHTVWHIFVLAGTACHFMAVYGMV
ncbi:hemolysin III family protein [Algoriphagus sp. H41]|uniref:Hemolysin III family protein n=1 Tax=Algoriphagus oliviformis TaxID=2811231 RepID=A0ABS3C361_9BACT|nr:hemolysin III family protein [Algoriphagus oliviformis]MBN7811049.1 hemolysin III family protein [Algoriphagus oliviformis]